MSDYFLDKFQKVPNEILQQKIDNASQYDPEAIKAAKIILNEREVNGIIIYEHPVTQKETSTKKPYLKATYSNSELSTAFSLALLAVSISIYFEYNSSAVDEENTIFNNRWFYLLTFYPVNHIFYRIENGHFNHFVQRYLQGLVFCIFFLIIRLIIMALTVGTDIKLDLRSIIGNTFGILLAVLILELTFTIIKRFLQYLKWRISKRSGN